MRHGCWIAFPLVLYACGDDTVDGGPCDVPALFATKCADSTCHGATNYSAELDLVSPGLEDRLAAVPASTAREAACGGMGRVLVDPDDLDNSLLLEKIEPGPSCGMTMPFGISSGLTTAEVQCLREFIGGL